MAFAFNPDDRPARLLRFVEPGTLPDADLVAVYDEPNNLVIIDRELFEQLKSVDQHLVKSIKSPFTSAVVHRHSVGAPTLIFHRYIPIQQAAAE